MRPNSSVLLLELLMLSLLMDEIVGPKGLRWCAS
jgi:hypothetical protein